VLHEGRSGMWHDSSPEIACVKSEHGCSEHASTEKKWGYIVLPFAVKSVRPKVTSPPRLFNGSSWNFHVLGIHLYKLQHILSLSFNIWNVYFRKSHVCRTQTAVPTDNYSQGKMPTKMHSVSSCWVNCHQDIRWSSGCQISMTHFLMFDWLTHSQINNSCLKIYPWQNTHLSVTAHPKRWDMRWAHHRHSSSSLWITQNYGWFEGFLHKLQAGPWVLHDVWLSVTFRDI
jgi:hypothetical protein